MKLLVVLDLFEWCIGVMVRFGSVVLGLFLVMVGLFYLVILLVKIDVMVLVLRFSLFMLLSEKMMVIGEMYVGILIRFELLM